VETSSKQQAAAAPPPPQQQQQPTMTGGIVVVVVVVDDEMIGLEEENPKISKIAKVFQKIELFLTSFFVAFGTIHDRILCTVLFIQL